MSARRSASGPAPPLGALQAPSSTELRLAARRAVTALRRTPRATAERALRLAENDENEENSPALEQLALYHLRQIAGDLEDEVREYLSTGDVRESGVVSFLLPSEESNRSGALRDLLESERVSAAQRSGALRALDERPTTRQPLRPRAAGGADASRRRDETFVVAIPAGIPRIADFEGIRDYSDQISARLPYIVPPELATPAAPAASKRVTIVEVEDEEDNPWSEDDEEIIISARNEGDDDDAASVERVVRELRAELVADRSFVATFRSGDMASTAREIERRLKERSESRLGGATTGREEEEETGDQRSLGDQRSAKDQRSAQQPRSSDKHYSMLPLLESTPLKTKPGATRRPTERSPSAAPRSVVEDPPERVSIGVGTSARDLLEQHHEQHSTGVQCELEESSHSHGGLFSSEESSSFGQVPDRLLQHANVRVVQPQPTPRPRTTAPLPQRVCDAAAVHPQPRMYASSADEEEEEEAENTLENLESIRDISGV